MRVQGARRVAFVAAIAIMVGAGRWLLSASVPQVAAGSWASASDIGSVPEGTAAAALADGRIVLAGGRDSEGTLISQIAIYNPAAGTWDDGGQMATARTGHTATALWDGRVLFAGGRTVNGVSSDVEIYNPNTRQSVYVGSLWVARINHAAAELGNGLVLVVGGSDGNNALDYAELFDSATGQTESLTARLSVAREKLTATRLLDGHVLIAGGRNESGNVGTAEIFASGSRSIFATGSLRTARSGHVAVLLPNNNQVLIAGGTVNGASSSSAELYSDWRDGFSTAPNAMAQARTGAVASALPEYELAFVGGGGASTGEFFGYATVKTDRADYWPGETVTITGAGWQPGETVTLKISEDADTHNDFTYTAVADAQGRIINTQFAPIENDVFHHFGMRFYVTATGSASTALNTFTDGNGTLTGVVTNSVTGAPIVGATVTCSSGCNAGTQPATTSAPSGSYTLNATFNGNSTTMTVTVSAAGYSNEQATIAFANNQAITRNFALVPSSTSTSVSVSSSANAPVYGDSVTFTATLTPSAATGTVQFKDGTTNLGAPVTVSSGQATFATSALLAGSHSITAVFSGTGAFGNSTSGTFNQAVSPKSLTITAANQTKVYGNVVTPAGTEFTTSALIGSDAVTSVTLSSPGYAATASVAGSPHAITPSAATGSGLANYSITYVPGTMTVSARAVTVTADPKTKTYGDADPSLTYQLTNGSLVGSDAFTGTLARVPGDDVGSYAIQQGSLALGTNYDVTFVGANLTITTRTIGVSAHPKSKTYGDADPTLTYQIATGSLVGSDSFSGTLSRAAGENVGTYAIQQGTLALSTNYVLTFAGANLTITARGITVTADAKSKTYGETDPALTYQVTSGTLVNGDAFTGGLTRLAGENVGSYAIQQGTLALSTNYVVTYAGANLTISARAITVTADAKTKTYGDADPSLTYQITDGSLVNGDTVTGGLTRVAGEDVGSYAVQQGTLALSTNYVLTFAGANLTITARGITVTADAKTKSYGESDPTLTYQVTSGSLVTGDAFTGDMTRATGENVGNYAIQQGTLALNGNYALTYVGADLTITSRSVTVTADPKSKTYGDADPTLTYQVTSGSLVNGDTFAGNLTRSAGENVGSYAIQQGTLALNGNYALTYVGADLTITTRSVTVTADSKSKTYGDADPTLTYQVTSGSLVNGDTFAGNLTRAAGENVGSYAIQQGTLALNGNYALTYSGANLTITARVVTVTADVKSKTYGDADPALTYQVTSGSVVNGDTFAGALTRAAGENVGSYAIQQGTLALNGNYALTFAGANLTISARGITVAADAKSKSYGDADPPLTYRVTSGSLVVGDSFAGALTRTPGENGGTYAIQQGTLALSTNYAVTYVGANLTITYGWSNVLQPINVDGSSIFKLGSTVPVKFQLTGASAAVTNLAAKIYVAKVSNGAVGTEVEAGTNANADAGNQFRYDPTGGLYIYNWGTKLGGAVTEGTWQIRIDLLDTLSHTVLVTLKK